MLGKLVIIAIILTTFMNVEAKKQPSFKPTNKPETKHSPVKKSPTSKPLTTHSIHVKSPTNKPVKSSANKPVKNKDDDNKSDDDNKPVKNKDDDNKQATLKPSLKPTIAIKTFLTKTSAAPSLEPTVNILTGAGLSNFLFACSNNGYATEFLGRAGWGLDQIGIVCSDGTKPGSFGGPGGNGFDVSNTAGFTSLDFYAGGSAGLGGFILNHDSNNFLFGENRGPWQGTLQSNSCPPGKLITAISGTYSYSYGSTTVQSLEIKC